VATPARLVQLECPRCAASHWVIDSDYRGAELLGRPELSYRQRTYTCSSCHQTGEGHRVLSQSPPEFFLQPHRLYPMTADDFDYWVGVLQEHFPDHPMLAQLNREWRPGPGDESSTPPS